MSSYYYLSAKPEIKSKSKFLDLSDICISKLTYDNYLQDLLN